MSFQARERDPRPVRRVVVTGVSAITPLGQDIDSTWSALIKGESGIGPISLFDASDFSVRIAGEVADWDLSGRFEKREAKHLDRCTQFGLAAALDAIADSGFKIDETNAGRVGVLFGSGIGGIQTLCSQVLVLDKRGPSRISPFLIPMMIPNIISGEVAIRTGAKGPNTCVVTACAASAHSIGEAVETIRRGAADVMIAGGAEAAVAELGIGGFSAMKALSTRNDAPEHASRPFDVDRDGFVAAEGAAGLVLEERDMAKSRGARIYGEIVGYGASGDAHHITAPDPEGDGAARAMSEAIRDAGATVEQVDYINAHGTSTPFNDRIETLAIKRAFGEAADKVAVSSTKSMTGHMLGAAGAVEAVICLKVLETGTLPPTINLENPDPDCDLDYVPNEARQAGVELAISNSFGFGGHNACLAIARA
ncbi:MAG: beta-ketoacyl-[acyl-carrier-protein] synthase II [Acidobacteria bacterium]|nr:MAG: beta-ketoacyl-[acyl-carrier-protein] synthase II [Acidobacteriota bacterium]